jgi:syntaxin 8
MATSSPSQLFLLADHIKLSLLERQRAISLNLSPNSQDGQISRSLDTLQAGITALEAQSGSLDADPSEANQIAHLRTQYNDLNTQFQGNPAPGSSATLTSPNDPALEDDFSAAQHASARAAKAAKSVRFTDSPSGQGHMAPYRDEPDDEDAPPDQSHLTNEQIHQYHKSVIDTQNEELDRLGQSIGRQRELTIAIGGELDDQAVMLDEVDERVDRHQNQLTGAQRRLGNFARKAKENWSMTTIVVLIIILVLLIVITK